MIPGTEEEFDDAQLVDDEKPAGGDGGGGKGKGSDETVTISKTELEAMRRETSELRQSTRDLMDIFRATGRRGAAVEPEETEEEEGIDPNEFVDEDAPDGEVEGDTPEKLVDEIAAQGVKALSKRGYVTVKDAQRIAVEAANKVARQIVGRERQKITSDAQIMSEFPDLKDKNSELFKETARRYQKAVSLDPNAKKTPATLYMAAEAAQEALKGKNGGRGGRRDEDDDRGYDGEDEEDRRARVSSQDSRPRGRARVDDDEDMIGDQAREVMRQMGISDDEFTAARKVTGGGGRGRGGRR
jgi:hypothetical protein